MEVFLDRDNNGIRYPEDYLGVYTLTEKIKRGPRRVAIHQLKREEITDPDISGGYLFKDDRPDPGDRGITLPDIGTYYFVNPKENAISVEQSRYLRNTLTDFTLAVKSPTGKHPLTKVPYQDFIDLRSWLVWHWLNVFAGNLDTYKASSYFYKNHQSRNEGRIEAGPLWDFDRSMNSYDDRDNNPFGWIANGNGGTAFSDSRAPWWGWLLNHREAMQAHIDLWHEMRADVLSWESLEKMIDEMAAELQGGGSAQQKGASSPVERNFGKWIQVSPRGGTHQHEIKILKDWLKLRLQWIDSQYTSPPAASEAAGIIPADSSVTLTGPKGALISYTLDGTDPLDSQSAQLAIPGTPIPIKQSSVLKARARLGMGAHAWSGILRNVYLLKPHSEKHQLEISEIDWTPKATGRDGPFQPYEFEYFKLTNPSEDQTVDLTGAEFRKGIEFTFDQSPFQKLGPKQSLYLVYNKAAFTHRHGKEKAGLVAGEFKTSRLNNTGEQIRLDDGAGRTLMDFKP